MKARNGSASQTKGKGNVSAPRAHEAGQVDSSFGSGDCHREQMIAAAAYFHAERRGFAPGNDLGDWLQAEADVEDLLRSAH